MECLLEVPMWQEYQTSVCAWTETLLFFAYFACTFFRPAICPPHLTVLFARPYSPPRQNALPCTRRRLNFGCFCIIISETAHTIKEYTERADKMEARPTRKQNRHMMRALWYIPYWPAKGAPATSSAGRIQRNRAGVSWHTTLLAKSSVLYLCEGEGCVGPISWPLLW